MKKFLEFDDIIHNLPTELYSKFQDLKLLRERPDYHPEESAYEHIKIVYNRCKQFNDYELLVSAIFHDITKYDDHKISQKTGYPTSPGHDIHGANLSKLWYSHFENLFEISLNIDKIYYICKNHMRIHDFHKMNIKKRNLFKTDLYFIDLVKFTHADDMLFEFNYEENIETQWLLKFN